MCVFKYATVFALSTHKVAKEDRCLTPLLRHSHFSPTCASGVRLSAYCCVKSRSNPICNDYQPSVWHLAAGAGMAATGAGRGSLSRLAARISWALFKRERVGIDELGNVYVR